MIRNKLNESKYENEPLRKNEFLQLSFKNSLIKNAKQHFLLDSLNQIKIPLILGVSSCPSLTDQDGPNVNEPNSKNEAVLLNLLNDFEIDQYSRDFRNIYSFQTNDKTGFSYEK